MGRFVSRKSGRTLYWESQFERDFMVHLELNSTVLRFREQPITTHFPVMGRTTKYTPDIYAEQDDGLFVYEVKPKEDLVDYAELFEAAGEFFSDHGYNFRVVTEDDIRIEPLLTNRQLLLRYSGHPIPPKAFDAARAILVTTGGCPLGDLADALQMHGGGLGVAYSLIARGFVSARIDQSLLTIHSIVSWR